VPRVVTSSAESVDTLSPKLVLGLVLTTELALALELAMELILVLLLSLEILLSLTPVAADIVLV